MRSQSTFSLGMAVLVVFVLSGPPAGAVLNNGFETNYFYALKTPGQDGELRLFNEADGSMAVDDLWPEVAERGWQSLTFSGTGETDARLFIAKEVDADNNGILEDIRIAELDSTAQTVKSVLLSTLAGGPVSTNLTFGSIRFSRAYPTSLFVGARVEVGGQSRGVAWEIDLGLTTLKNTYTGPTVPPPDVGDTALRPVMIDINDATRKLYMTARHMGEPTCTGSGDLVELDLANGSTNVYTTLIDGPTYRATNPMWLRPQCVIFRSSNPTDGTPTILVGPANSNWQEVLEFYLDTTAHPKDANGNLQRRTHPSPPDPLEVKFPGRGQEDEVTRSIWLAGFTGGVYELEASDGTREFSLSPWYADVDSPFSSVPPCPDILPVIPSPDETFTGSEYLKQLTLKSGAPPITWTLVQGPPGAQIDSTGRVHGWTPTLADIGFVTFEVGATNPTCAVNPSTETWTVRVVDEKARCNGFRADWVYLSRKPGEGGNIRVFYETDDPLVVAVDDFQPDDTNFCSITFAGRGNNDCRLFGIRGDPLFPATATDIQIVEFNAAGNIIKQVKLGAIAPGYGANNLGPAVEPLNIRYSRFHNSLFIGVNQNKNAASPARAMEVDLELTTVLNVYQGPDIVDGGVAIDIDWRDGTLYMTNRSLNGTAGKGDLIGFDTAQGSTSTYATLIDGDTVTGSSWDAPGGVVYRHRLCNPSHRPTILVLMTGTTELRLVPEFYLDAQDANQNLLLRGEPISLRQAWAAQMDEATCTIWFAPADGGGSVNGLRRDDTVYQPEDPLNWMKPWVDVDSPPARLSSPCSPVVFADADGDGDVDATDFGIVQACLAPEAGTIPGEPAYCVCLDHNGDGDTDSQDFLDFLACGTGPAVPFNASDPPDGCEP